MTVGVLALQGDFDAHAARLRELGAAVAPVRTAGQLAAVDGLVLPGGESTTMLRLLARESLDRPLADRVASGMPVLATCAGVILLARGVRPLQPTLGVLDVDVVRNAYGRQLHSTVAPIALEGAVGDRTMEAVFIRAPRIARCGPGVTVLGRWQDDPVLVRAGRILAATFHPELTPDPRVHRWFLELAAAAAA